MSTADTISRAHRGDRQVHPTEQRQRLEPAQRVDAPVRVNRAHRTGVTGVERLQQVEGFAAAYLADHDSVGAHPQRRAHEVAHGGGAGALTVRGPCLEPHHMRLREAQLRGLLDRDDATVAVDAAGERVQQRGLARARTAGDEHVGTTRHPLLQPGCGVTVEAELFERDRTRREAPDGDNGAVRRERRQDRVQP